MNQTDLVVLLSCVKTKRNYECKAADMYTSLLFQKTMAYARRLKPRRIFILSAKYGLLKVDDVIEPYEQTLNEMKSDERKLWAQSAISTLRKNCNLDEDNFIFLAGHRYRENLSRCLRHCEAPMEGLSFGKQLQWLDHQASRLSNPRLPLP